MAWQIEVSQPRLCQPTGTINAQCHVDHVHVQSPALLAAASFVGIVLLLVCHHPAPSTVIADKDMLRCLWYLPSVVQGVALLPWIDEQRLMDATTPLLDQLTDEEKYRSVCEGLRQAVI